MLYLGVCPHCGRELCMAKRQEEEQPAVHSGMPYHQLQRAGFDWLTTISVILLIATILLCFFMTSFKTGNAAHIPSTVKQSSMLR